MLPVFNGGQHIAEAVSSILSQTFSDFELIVIDDGSTDNTPSELQQFKGDSRLILISRENRGLVESLNEGIDLAKGEWIARMDSDDISLPERFEKQIRWLETTGADICGCWVRRFGSSDKRTVKLRQTDSAIKLEMLFSSPFVHPAIMMKAHLLKQFRYDKVWKHTEDYDLWDRAAEAGCKMTNLPEVLLLYRMHEAQVSSTASLQQQQNTQRIRLRCGARISEALQIDFRAISHIVCALDGLDSDIDLDLIDKTLVELLEKSPMEARLVILDHAARTYLKVAYRCPNVLTRWCKLANDLHMKPGLSMLLKLFFVKSLRIRPSGKFFDILKKIHVFVVRKT